MPSVLVKLVNGESFTVEIEGYEEFISLEEEFSKWWKRLIKFNDSVVVKKTAVYGILYLPQESEFDTSDNLCCGEHVKTS